MSNLKLHLAVELAAIAHQNQKRKGTNTPYIVHPFETAQILTQAQASEQAIIAGILHDTLEDTFLTELDLQEEFGERIVQIVVACSEDKSVRLWEARKAHTIRFMSECSDLDILQVSCADKLSNLRSMQSDVLRIGDKLWGRFKRTKEKISWYYSELLVAYEKELRTYEMYRELNYLHNELFRNL